MESKDRILVVIPARNEEKYLQSCLDSLHFAAENAKKYLDIVVVVNRSTDNTEEIAKSNGCLVIFNEEKNLSAIRNAGIRSSTIEYIMTVDADSKVSKNIFKEMCRLLNSDKYVGGGVVILPERYSLGILVSGLFLAIIALFYRIQCGAFFFKREYFEAIKGFNENIYSAEDIDFAIRLKKYGKSIKKNYSFINLAFIITSCRKFDHFGDWYFITNFPDTLKLLQGKGRALADKIWYDFKR